MITTFFIGAFMAYAVEALKEDYPRTSPFVCGGLGGTALTICLLAGLS